MRAYIASSSGASTRPKRPSVVALEPITAEPAARKIADATKISGPYAAYFKQLAKANEGNVYYFGTPIQVMQGKPKEVFTQVINNALPAGSISVDEVVKQMNAAK